MSMPTQRTTSKRDPGQRAATSTRRAYLAGAAAFAVGSSGCQRVLGDSRERSVSVLSAGSLQRALAEGLSKTVSVPVRVESHGSLAAARLVAAGKRDPDVIALADPVLFSDPLDTDWYGAFATNSLVVAVSDRTAGGRRVRDADRWFEPILAGRASLGRTDPTLDPLGYRTLFMLDLATTVYDRPELSDRVISRSRLYPETSLLSRLESGAVDAAVVYRSMAQDRDLPARELPPEIDLGSARLADHYATATYRVPDGPRLRGGPISYGAWARPDERVRSVYRALVAGEYLADFGFETPAAYPRLHGSPPQAIEV